MPDALLSEKTGRAILEELRAIRRNEEAQMSEADKERVRSQQMEKAGYRPEGYQPQPSETPTKTATKFDVSKAPSRRGGGAV